MSRPCAYVPATSVIDPTAPGGIEAMLEFHRATFGDARMDAGTGDAGGENGGSGSTGTTGTGSSTSDTGQGGSTGTTSTSSAEQSSQDDAQQQSGQGLPDDPEVLKGIIADLRRENASDRTNAKATAAEEARTQLVQELGKALGLVKDGEDTPKPEELTAQVQAAQAAARQSAIELAVFKTASTHQGDPNALLDSRTFLAKVADLDPAAADFQGKVDAAIKEAVDGNPKLKAAPVATTSSVDHAGGTGDSTRRTPKPLTDAVRAAYGSN